MKVRDFIKQDISIDVRFETGEKIATFTGPLHLTAEGEKRFSEGFVLDYNINVYADSVSVYGCTQSAYIELEGDIWQRMKQYDYAVDFFDAVAHEEEKWNEWFYYDEDKEEANV